ncbi:MAG: hypothetical protein A2622_05505 [Bdellovibrionales bacterium RIFCSPHIGHO2_01_FULL_40_29]|nr:MAG: hypothetical protein A2622_05505 [Bdellovibrionales bacterium RIFCSPHIGHO2_01_FULL_40_29]OFZ33146.1 MAG: hypothetical protein A3D17_13365 [Bdellovibrionales bacterium RIFCSPHIGHO2_02_FULL_40_15]
MGISDNIKNMASNLQQGAKNTTVTLTQKILRVISGLFLALIASLIIQEMMQSGTLMLIFFIVLFTAVIYIFLGRLTVLQILIFDLICVLIVSLMRLYIMVAP